MAQILFLLCRQNEAVVYGLWLCCRVVISTKAPDKIGSTCKFSRHKSADIVGVFVTYIRTVAVYRLVGGVVASALHHSGQL